MIRIDRYDWSMVDISVNDKLLHGRVLKAKNGDTYTMICRILPNTVGVLTKMLDSIHWDINRQHAYENSEHRSVSSINIKKLRKDKHVLNDIIESISDIVNRYPAYGSDMYVMRDSSGHTVCLDLKVAVKLFDIGGARYEGNRY